MKRLWIYLYFLGFLLICTGLMAQRPAPDYVDQAKRDARTNDHIEKQMEGKIIKHVYRGVGLGLWAIIFKSDQNEYYHISIKRGDGHQLINHLTTNRPVKITVSGDPKLLEEVIYLRPEYAKIQNELDIELKGLAHLQVIESRHGTYKRDKSATITLPSVPELFHEEVSIVKKKKAYGNRWAYILGNDDTIMVKYEDNDLMKGRDKVSYFNLTSIGSKGVYFKSPNTYHVLGGVPFVHDRTQMHPRELMVGKGAVILDHDNFEVIRNRADSRGLFNSLEVKRGNDTLTLLFNAKNGKDIRKVIEGSPSFKAYYKTRSDESLMLYAINNGHETTFFNNSDEPFQDKNNYEDGTMAFNGEITQVEFGRPDNGTELKNFVIDDSIYVAVNQIVALNIQKMIAVGKKITVEGWLRKKIPGEVNIRGYAILAASAITIDGKTFKQIYHDLKKTL